MKKTAPTRTPVVHPYARISHPDQRKGGGLERQTQADVETFARQFGFAPSKRLLVDDGVSAFHGLNATPEHQLGQFLAEARKGLIPPGDCLLIENYDRLSRQDVWAAIGLVNDLRQLGIHVGRLDRMKLLRCDSTDPGDFFEAAIELMRGNSESRAKSDRNSKAWGKKRDAARGNGAVITRRLPAWVEEKDGRLVLVNARAAIVRRLFALAAGGHGHASIVKRLTAEGVPAMGASGCWVRSYVANILADRRAIGEYQPRRRNGEPDGEPIPDYYPAVVSEEEWLAARAGAAERKNKPGRVGKHVNVFAGLLRNARDGDTYYAATRTERGTHHRILINTASAEGRAPCYSFPLATFERAVLSLLREIDPHEILNGDSGPDETLALSGQITRVDESIALIEADMNEHGESPTLFKRLRAQEDLKRDLVKRLAEARQKAANPLSEAWGEAQTLLGALDAAPDPHDARLRLRSALRRIVEGIWMLVVPRGRDRLCAVQIVFAGGERSRSYLILHRPPKGNVASRRRGGWAVRSFADAGLRPGANYDFRRPEDVEELARDLLAVPVALPLPADRAA
jgi:DNA invertase Pin-like site-specific DNA recombinase